MNLTESWPARMFSVANAKDDRPDDLPYLLRRLADRIEALDVDPADILDLTVSSEITADGPWWSATLYWAPETRDDHEPDQTGSRTVAPPRR